jgi:hypothetical protein
MQAPHHEALCEVDILVTMGDFMLARKDVNAAINTSEMYTGSSLPLCSLSCISESSCVDCITFNS